MFCEIVCFIPFWSAILRTLFRLMIVPLWKLLIDKDLGKYEMIKMAGLSPYTLNKLNHNENVNAETLAKMLMYGKEASNRKQ